MGQSASNTSPETGRSILRHARDPSFVAPLALVVLILATASARKDEDWMRDLSGYWKDPFERGLAAIALAEQSPGRGPLAVEPLVEILDGPRELLHPAARRALQHIASHDPEALVRCLREHQYVRDATRVVLEDSLAAAATRPSR